MTGIKEVLHFWFGSIQETAAYLQQRSGMWFQGGPSVDNAIRDSFEPLLKHFDDRTQQEWASHPAGRLAAIVVLDQFPRNLYRQTAAAFARDAEALRLCQQGLSLNVDRMLHPVQRLFFYLPLEHSESLAIQEASVQQFTRLWQDAPAPLKPSFEVTLNYAVRHFEIIQTFGRFPHRNQALGRASTPEEIAFLQEPNSSF